MAKQTYSKEERKAQFLKTGLALAKKDGVSKVSVAAVAAANKITAPLVFHVFGNREKMHAAIKREAKKQKVVLPVAPKKAKKAAVTTVTPDPSAPASARKRSVAEVKAIKDKAAGKRPAKGSASATGKRPARKVGRSAKDGKFVDKATVAANPATTVVQRVRAPRKKYPTHPMPAVTLPDEPKAAL